MELYLSDLRSDYVELVRYVADVGASVDVRGLKTRELTGVTLVFSDPDAPLLPVGVGRRVNATLAAVEALSVVAGRASGALLRHSVPTYTDVLVDPADPEYGAYGPRLRSQLFSIVRHLRDDSTSRRAVAAIWQTDDLNHDGDRPCTLTLQFIVRDGRLEMIVNMRSQDVWLGAGMDMFVFGQLRDSVAYTLGLEPGRYVHHVGSLHLYDTDLVRVDELVAPTGDAPALPRGVVPDRLTSGDLHWYERVKTATELLRLAEPPDLSHSASYLGAHAECLRAAGNDWYVTKMLALRDRGATTTTGGTTC